MLAVGKGKYLSSTVSPFLLEQIYTTSELCVRFILQFNIFHNNNFNLLSYILYFFVCKFDYFLRRYIRRQKGLYFIKHIKYIYNMYFTVIENQCSSLTVY